LTYENIVRIIESQINATVDGMATGDAVVWKYFGTFSATKIRVDALNKKYDREGKPRTLDDHGLIRMSFKKSGEQIGSTELIPSTNKRDFLEVPDKYKE
jgi:hypothetical protein